MPLNSGFARLFAALPVAAALALALPAAALAAATPATVSGAATVAENGAKVTYTITCGNGDPAVPPIPPDVPFTGTIAYTTSDAGATAGSDYTATSGSVSCLTTKTHTVDVAISEDAVDEVNEAFKFTISQADPGAPPAPGWTIDPAEVTTTITDNDAPVASIESLVQVAEGNSGTSNATLKVTLDQAAANAVTIPYSTSDYNTQGSADYQGGSGQITIPAGGTEAAISIPIVGDTVHEQTEGFFVTLGAPTNAALNASKSQGIVVIYNDDVKPTGVFSLAGNKRVTEGDDGTVNMVFTVNLSLKSDEPTQVAWKTANWTATLGDYEGGQGIVKFAAGETSKTISINVKGDRRDEADEMFVVLLEGPVGAALAGGNKDKALGIIEDDDLPRGPKVGVEGPDTDRRILSVQLSCPAKATTGCKGVLKVRRKGLRFRKARFDLAKGESDEVRTKMSRKTFKRLQNRGRKAKFIAKARDGESEVRKSKQRLKIKKISP